MAFFPTDDADAERERRRCDLDTLRTTPDGRFDYGYVRLTLEYETHDHQLDMHPRTPLVPVVRCRVCGRLERLDGKDPISACLWITRFHELCRPGRPCFGDVPATGSPSDRRRTRRIRKQRIAELEALTNGG